MDDSMEKVIDILAKNRYIKNFNFEILDKSSTRLYARMPLKEDIINPFGGVHGGALYSMADIIGGALACLSGKLATTVSSSFNYMLPAINTEYVYCDANILREGTNIIVVSTKLYDDSNRLLDDGTFTFYKTNVPIA